MRVSEYADRSRLGGGGFLGLAGAGVVGGLAAVWAERIRRRYRADLARARLRLAELGSQVAETACGPIEYATAGDGVPVLEVHGMFGGFDQGIAAARPILGAGFRVIAPSRFGYLRTPLPAGASSVGQADAHACLLDHLGIERVAVMAHSAGSVSAIQLALRHPQRVAALLLMVPAAPGPGPTTPPRPAVHALFRTDALIWFLTTFIPSSLPTGAPKGLELTPDDHVEIGRLMETLLPATSRRDGFLFDLLVTAPTINGEIPFGDVSVPTLVVTASDDPLAFPGNARRLAALIPGARLFEAERGGHLLIRQTEAVGEEVRHFIRDHTTSG